MVCPTGEYCAPLMFLTEPLLILLCYNDRIGCLPSEAGSRAALSTDTMERKLLEMSQRIRQLEDVVQILQGIRSNKPHPLLDEKYLSIKSLTSGEDDNDERNDDGGRGEMNALTDALGTLAIADSGEVRFMGRVSNEVRLLFIETLLGAQCSSHSTGIGLGKHSCRYRKHTLPLSSSYSSKG